MSASMRPSAENRARMIGLILGGAVSQAICSAVELRLPEALASGPRALDELVAECGADRWYLERLLRALMSFGVLGVRADGAFELAPLGETLLTHGADGLSLAGMALFAGSGWLAEARAALTESIRTGVSAFRVAHGADLYECLENHPDLAALYEGWAGYSSGVDLLADSVLAVYDFSRARHVVDVGGRYGVLLAHILQTTPGLTGTLFDLPGVEAQARAHLESQGVGERCSLVTGSFFDAVPTGGDLYVLSNVLADWNDERAGQILRNCRQAMKPDGVLLAIETVFPLPALESRGVSIVDLWMMIHSGGLRDEDGLRRLIAAGGFRIARMIPTASAAATLIEATPA
jgi:SAM-dependent methyltransferase